MTLVRQDSIPDHVPDEVVLNYDYLGGPEVDAFPPTALETLRDARRVFYSPLYGGTWVFTRYADIRQLFQDHEHLQPNIHGIPPIRPAQNSIPLNLNPPEHTTWRQLLLPLFAPAAATSLDPLLRDAARRQVEVMAAHGHCEAFEDYAVIVPVARFCFQLGLPSTEFRTFLDLAHNITHGTKYVAKKEGLDAAAAYRAKNAAEIQEIIMGVIAERRRQRADDLVSTLMDSTVDGRAVTDDEIRRVMNLLFTAGTDTTASAIAWALLHLATNPSERQLILEQPDKLAPLIEEMLRFYTSRFIPRDVVKDVEIAGVLLKAGDAVLLPTGAANRDTQFFEGPEEFDIDRKRNPHLTFGAGVHRCLGIHYARKEISVAIEEFHRLIPSYELDPAFEMSYVHAGKSRPSAVPLIYPAVTA